MLKYSVIMPVFNSEKTIERAIQSVFKQTYKNWELIIIDDGSFDSTKKILEKYLKDSQQIKYIFQKNSGPGVARNKGIEISSGDYLCFLDSDDYWENNFLGEVDSIINKEKSDIVFYDLVHENEKGKLIGFSSPSKFSRRPIDELVFLQSVGTLEWGMTKVVRSSIVKQNNVKFSELIVGEESIFSIEILRYSRICSFIKKPLYHYVDYQKSQHNKGDLDPWYPVVTSVVQYLNNNPDFFEKYRGIPAYLAMKSFAINANRICLSNKYRLIKTQLRESLNKYMNYDIFTCKKRNLETKVWIVKILARLRCFFLINLLAKIRG